MGSRTYPDNECDFRLEWLLPKEEQNLHEVCRADLLFVFCWFVLLIYRVITNISVKRIFHCVSGQLETSPPPDNILFTVTIHTFLDYTNK